MSIAISIFSTEFSKKYLTHLPPFHYLEVYWKTQLFINIYTAGSCDFFNSKTVRTLPQSNSRIFLYRAEEEETGNPLAASSTAVGYRS